MLHNYSSRTPPAPPFPRMVVTTLFHEGFKLRRQTSTHIIKHGGRTLVMMWKHGWWCFLQYELARRQKERKRKERLKRLLLRNVLQHDFLFHVEKAFVLFSLKNLFQPRANLAGESEVSQPLRTGGPHQVGLGLNGEGIYVISSGHSLDQLGSASSLGKTSLRHVIPAWFLLLTFHYLYIHGNRNLGTRVNIGQSPFF